MSNAVSVDVDALLREKEQLLALIAKRDETIKMLRNELTVAESRSLIDGLTGVLNRRGFDELYASMFAHARRTQRALVIVFADIDLFKRVNDTHGHSTGDQVLREFAGLLKNGVRTDDAVARYGGEEFVILLPDTTSSAVQTLITRLHERIAMQTMQAGQITLSVTASFGVAEWCDGDTKEALLERADSALYAAKNSGRNRIAHASVPLTAWS